MKRAERSDYPPAVDAAMRALAETLDGFVDLDDEGYIGACANVLRALAGEVALAEEARGKLRAALKQWLKPDEAVREDHEVEDKPSRSAPPEPPSLTPGRVLTPSTRGFTVSSVDDGTAVAVMDATPEDAPDVVYADRKSARAAAARMAHKLMCAWFDRATGVS